MLQRSVLNNFFDGFNLVNENAVAGETKLFELCLFAVL